MLEKVPITDEELESGLVRLAQGGLIAQGDDRFLPTNKIPDTLRNLDNPIDMKKRIEDLIDAEKWSKRNNVNDPRNKLKYPGLTREKIKKADTLYHKRISTQL